LSFFRNRKAKKTHQKGTRRTGNTDRKPRKGNNPFFHGSRFHSCDATFAVGRAAFAVGVELFLDFVVGRVEVEGWRVTRSGALS